MKFESILKTYFQKAGMRTTLKKYDQVFVIKMAFHCFGPLLSQFTLSLLLIFVNMALTFNGARFLPLHCNVYFRWKKVNMLLHKGSCPFRWKKDDEEWTLLYPRTLNVGTKGYRFVIFSGIWSIKYARRISCMLMRKTACSTVL